MAVVRLALARVLVWSRGNDGSVQHHQKGQSIDTWKRDVMGVGRGCGGSGDVIIEFNDVL